MCPVKFQQSDTMGEGRADTQRRYGSVDQLHEFGPPKRLNVASEFYVEIAK